MGIITVTLQDRFKCKRYITESKDNKFRCPICEEEQVESWVDKNILKMGASFIIDTCTCKTCGSEFSVNR